jgi:hypothetical protein
MEKAGSFVTSVETYQTTRCDIPDKNYLLTSYPKVKVTLRPTISRSVRLGFEARLGLMTRY